MKIGRPVESDLPLTINTVPRNGNLTVVAYNNTSLKMRCLPSQNCNTTSILGDRFLFGISWSSGSGSVSIVVSLPVGSQSKIETVAFDFGSFRRLR